MAVVAAGDVKVEVLARKVYSCRVCGEAMSAPGHTQFRGQRYCPNTPGQTLSVEEWRTQRRAEAAKRKADAPDRA